MQLAISLSIVESSSRALFPSLSFAGAKWTGFRYALRDPNTRNGRANVHTRARLLEKRRQYIRTYGALASVNFRTMSFRGSRLI